MRREMTFSLSIFLTKKSSHTCSSLEQGKKVKEAKRERVSGYIGSEEAQDRLLVTIAKKNKNSDTTNLSSIINRATETSSTTVSCSSLGMSVYR